MAEEIGGDVQESEPGFGRKGSTSMGRIEGKRMAARRSGEKGRTKQCVKLYNDLATPNLQSEF
jgi:hypothetical protein